MNSACEILTAFAGFEYKTDARKPPDDRRFTQFKTGWSAAASGRKYTQGTLDRLTWNNCGHRLGGEFDPDKENVAYAYSVLSRLYFSAPRDANLAREAATIEATIEGDATFSPEFMNDHRDWILRPVVSRPGQANFRRLLLDAYGGQCAVTDCNVEAALDAAHIAAYRGEQFDHVTNGLLLRSDIHKLFDFNLIKIDPSTMTVVLDDSLLSSCYSEYANKSIRLPATDHERPSAAALKYRWDATS